MFTIWSGMMNCKEIIFKENEKFYCRNIQEGLLTHTRRAGKTSARYDPMVNCQRWEGIQYEKTGRQAEKKIQHKHVRGLAAWCRWGRQCFLFFFPLWWWFSCQDLSNWFVTLWAAVRQAPLSMGFPKQKSWSGLPSPSLGMFPTQGSNLQLHVK